MKTSIVTITYDKDLEFLKYNLKSIQKFCHGYHENIVVIDDHENDCVETQKYLETIGQKYFINKEAKKIKKVTSGNNTWAIIWIIIWITVQTMFVV